VVTELAKSASGAEWARLVQLRPSQLKKRALAAGVSPDVVRAMREQLSTAQYM
jgi:hypothetical protein